MALRGDTGGLGLGPTPPHLQRRRSTDQELGSWSVKWHLVIQIVGYVVGLFVVYNAMTNRITATETGMSYMQQDIREMKGDIKTLLQRDHQ